MDWEMGSVGDSGPGSGEYVSKVVRTLSASKSVHATIPQVIATLIGAKPGSNLIWTFDRGTGSVTVRITPGLRRPKKSSKRD